MSYAFPITTGWSAINVNDSAYLARTWFVPVTSQPIISGCSPPIDITACAYLGAHEFTPGSSLANFVGADAPKIGDFINTYDYTNTSGNINGRRCIEIVDIIEELTYLTGVVTCPGTFQGDTPPYGNGNFNVYGYVPWGSPPCPCTVQAIVPQGISVGSHWNSPYSLQTVLAQPDPIPLSSRFTNCQTCIQSTPFQDCGCTDPLATNFVHQYGSHALQPCCTLCDGTDDNDCCTYTTAGCKDNNAWNYCSTCTEDCAGVTLSGAWIWSNVDTTCCRHTCPPIIIEATWDCCTYATCPETFNLHYGPNSDWGIANPGQPTPSVNPHSKFCQERFDGTGQYNSLGGKNGCNWNCKLNPQIIHHTVDAPKVIQISPSGFPKITDEEIEEVQRLNKNFVSIDYPQQPIDDESKFIQTDSLQTVSSELPFELGECQDTPLGLVTLPPISGAEGGPPSCPCGWGPNGIPKTNSLGIYQATWQPWINPATMTNVQHTHPTCMTWYDYNTHPFINSIPMNPCWQEYLTMPFCIDHATGNNWHAAIGAGWANCRLASDLQAMTNQQRQDIFNNTYSAYGPNGWTNPFHTLGVHPGTPPMAWIPVFVMDTFGLPSNQPNPLPPHQNGGWAVPAMRWFKIDATGLLNYNTTACFLEKLACPNTCLGCTDLTSTTCITNPGACQAYDPTASYFWPDLSSYPVVGWPPSSICCVNGCTTPGDPNYNPLATCDDGSCVYGGPIYGCMDPNAVICSTNPACSAYDSAATIDDGTCCIQGCTNSNATNYNTLANCDDGSCVYFNPNLIVNCCDPNEIYQIGPNPLTNYQYKHSAQGTLDLHAITGVTNLNITNYTQAFRANFVHTETFSSNITGPGATIPGASNFNYVGSPLSSGIDCSRNTGYKCWRLAEQDPNWTTSPYGSATGIDLMPAKRYDSCNDLNTKLTNGDWVSQIYTHWSNWSGQYHGMQPHKTWFGSISLGGLGWVETDVFHIYPNLCAFNPNRIANCCDPNYQWQICGNMLKQLTEAGRILRFTASGQPVTPYSPPSNWYTQANLGISSYTQSFRANFWFNTNQDPWNITIYIPGIGHNKWLTWSACWHLTESTLYAPSIKSYAFKSGPIEIFPSCRHLNMHLYATMVSPWPYWGSLYTGNTNIPPWCAYSYIDTTGTTQGGAVMPCDPCPPPDQTSPFYSTVYGSSPAAFCKRCVQGGIYHGHIDCGCCYPSPSPIVKTKCHCCNKFGQPVMPNNNDYTDCTTLDGTLANWGTSLYGCKPVNQTLLCKKPLPPIIHHTVDTPKVIQTDLSQTVVSGLPFNPNRIVNCCDPTEEYQIGSDILQILAGTGPQQQVQHTIIQGNSVVTGNLGITNYTEAFRANFMVPLTQPPWNHPVYPALPHMAQEIPTNRKCWHLKESNSPAQVTLINGTTVSVSQAPYVSGFAGAFYGLLTDKFPSCRHLNMWLFTRPYFDTINNIQIFGGPPYCGFNSSLFHLSAITSCEPCPPPDHSSPFYTNPDEFCNMCGPGQYYYGHIDCGCCYPSPSPLKIKCHCCNKFGQPVMPNNNDYTDCTTLDGTLANWGTSLYGCKPVNQTLLCKKPLPPIPTISNMVSSSYKYSPITPTFFYSHLYL